MRGHLFPVMRFSLVSHRIPLGVRGERERDLRRGFIHLSIRLCDPHHHEHYNGRLDLFQDLRRSVLGISH